MRDLCLRNDFFLLSRAKRNSKLVFDARRRRAPLCQNPCSVLLCQSRHILLAVVPRAFCQYPSFRKSKESMSSLTTFCLVETLTIMGSLRPNAFSPPASFFLHVLLQFSSTQLPQKTFRTLACLVCAVDSVHMAEIPSRPVQAACKRVCSTRQRNDMLLLGSGVCAHGKDIFARRKDDLHRYVCGMNTPLNRSPVRSYLLHFRCLLRAENITTQDL